MKNKFYRTASRLLGKPFDLDNYKHQAECICPEEHQQVPPAIYLEKHLQRVKGTHHMSSLAYEQERLMQTVTHHAATTLYSIGKVKLFRGGLWTEKHEFMPRLLKKDDEIYRVNIDNAVLTDSDIVHQYFGHWLSDAVPTALVGHSKMQSISFRKPHYLHAQGYLDLFDLNIVHANSGTCNSLFLLEDFSQNSYKVERYLELRQRLKANSGNLVDSTYAGVFMARGQTGVKRSLINEQQLIEHLRKKNFDILYPEKMTPLEIVRRLWNAPMVIAVEGSALNHSLYSLALNGAYLVLQPPHLFNNMQKGVCDAMNRPYGFYVCQPTQNPDEFYLDSFSDLDKIIDLLREESLKRLTKNRGITVSAESPVTI